jgi:hypothetical protein
MHAMNGFLTVSSSSGKVNQGSLDSATFLPALDPARGLAYHARHGDGRVVAGGPGF